MSLRELKIRNFAIIQSLDIELGEGLTVVTGETGAGKSIILDALGLLLGSRADVDMIRHNEERCEITAIFEIDSNPAVQAWLRERDLLDSNDQSCLVRRILQRSKPTRCYVNDQPMTLASVRQLGLLLVDLHSQHEHQSLLQRVTQRAIVDQFANHAEKIGLMAKYAATIKRIEAELEIILQKQGDNADRLQLLAFQLAELDELELKVGEYEQLTGEFSRLSNAQELIHGIQASLDHLFLNEDSNISTQLGNAVQSIEKLTEMDQNLRAASNLLSSSLSQIDDAQADIQSALHKISLDPERLHEVEARLGSIIEIARKHHCNENELFAKHQQLLEEQAAIKNAAAEPTKMQHELDQFKVRYFEIAAAVSRTRNNVAKQLSKAITAQLQGLGMQGGRVEIQVNSADHTEAKISENGIDDIEFLVSTNPDTPLKSLRKTASGGELSRISLAIQVVTCTRAATPTLVFDEIDVGVGGTIANTIGKQLHQLGRSAQVLCITHQPQIASLGQMHLFVDKHSSEEGTSATIKSLDLPQRAAEIARMLGGDESSDQTLEHAREMLSRASA